MAKYFRSLDSLIKASLLSFTALFLSVPVAADSAITLRPYEARYAAVKDHIPLEIRRKLTRSSNHHWMLEDSAQVFFFTLSQSAEMHVEGGTVTPQIYRYRQSPGFRDQDLSFDWKNLVARTEYDKGIRESVLTIPTYDLMSYQVQLRLDLAAKLLDKPRTYTLLDRANYMHYRVKKLGKETITVGNHQINTIKLQQTFLEKQRNFLIWVAPDLDYILVRLEQADDGFTMHLKSASLLPATLSKTP